MRHNLVMVNGHVKGVEAKMGVIEALTMRRALELYAEKGDDRQTAKRMLDCINGNCGECDIRENCEDAFWLPCKECGWR